MGYSKDQLLTRLSELEINFVCYDHPVVLTVEAQAKYVGHLGGGISKNLFLKDKKHRFYIVSALVGTTVDLKVLSQRLGVGKGGLRMAPEESLQQILQVPLGCVTPFALVNESARDVTLLLDQGFKSQEHCLFHPLSNDVTISLSARDLEKFLVSIGKGPSYVDLEATPTVGKDQPPDLAGLVPSSAIALPDQPEKAILSKPTTENHVPVENKPKVVTESVKDKPVSASNSLHSGANVRKFIDDILDKTSALVISQITSETIQKHGEQLGTVVSDGIRQCLSSDLERVATMFKNIAYTEGFHTGAQTGYVRKCQP